MRVKFYKEDELVNIARNNGKQGNVERIPIYDYSAKNAYFNPHNRLGPNPGEEFAVRSNIVREVDRNEPEAISEAELQRILRQDDEVSREEVTRIDNIDRSNVGIRNEPDEISKSEMRKILREDDVLSAEELQTIMKESGATKAELLETLRKDSKNKEILRNADFDTFAFPPNAKTHPLRITPLDLQQILDDKNENSYANIKPVVHDNFSAKKIYSAPHKLNVDYQKLMQEDVPRLKHILASRDEDYSAEDSDRMWKMDEVRKSLRRKTGNKLYLQNIVLDLQKFADDRRLVNILNARSNNKHLGEIDVSEQKVRSGNQLKSKPKKQNFVFKSILPENSDISDVIEKAPMERVSTDYFDLDYYFGRRERGRTDLKKFINNNSKKKILRSEHGKFFFIILLDI